MNSNHLASIARSEKICFDYMDFLSASFRKHWRFVDAIFGVMPIFGMVLKSRVTTSQTRKELLKELALQVVSTQVSVCRTRVEMRRAVRPAGGLPPP